MTPIGFPSHILASDFYSEGCKFESCRDRQKYLAHACQQVSTRFCAIKETTVAQGLSLHPAHVQKCQLCAILCRSRFDLQIIPRYRLGDHHPVFPKPPLSADLGIALFPAARQQANGAPSVKKTAIQPANIRTLPPGDYADGGGLYLIVRDRGSRSWQFKYQWPVAGHHQEQDHEDRSRRHRRCLTEGGAQAGWDQPRQCPRRARSEGVPPAARRRGGEAGCAPRRCSSPSPRRRSPATSRTRSRAAKPSGGARSTITARRCTTRRWATSPRRMC